MSQIDFFKRQAKNLNSDIKTQFFNEQEGIFEYKPRFFDINNGRDPNITGQPL